MRPPLATAAALCAAGALAQEPSAARAAVLVGGRGGWIIDHTVVLGIGGYGLASRIAAPDVAQTAAATTAPGRREGGC